MKLSSLLPERVNQSLRPLARFFNDQQKRIELLIRCIKGDDIWVLPSIKCKKLKLGSKDGEWCIFPESIDASSIIYSFGVGFDISFDLAIIKRFGAQVHAFDPTPLSKDWLHQQSPHKNFRFHPYGLSTFDGPADFFLPLNHNVSFTMSPEVENKSKARGEVCRFGTILKKLGHEKVHIVKLDIEGAEYDVLPEILQEKQRIEQLLVEFHHRMIKSENGLKRTRKAIKMIEDAGFSLFYVSPRGLEYCFLRKDRSTSSPGR